MAKPLFDIISVNRLRRLAENPAPDDAIGLLAKTVIEIYDARGADDAATAFSDVMHDYFYNLAAASKRRHADALALNFCAERKDFDDLWEFLKRAGVTGRTTTRRADV